MKGRNNQRQPQIVENLDSDDDEEIPEDEAFNSEDERRYGSFFDKKQPVDSSDDSAEDSEEDSDSEEEDGIAPDDEDSEGDGGQYMLDLLNKLDGSPTNEKGNEKDSIQLATNGKESEFSSSVVQGTNLTLDALMEGLEDTKGFGVMQKAMKDMSNREATSAPVSRKVSDRAQRKVHYEHQSEEVSQWINAVKQNREAETLDFRPKARMQVTREQLVEKFFPTTEFEIELAAALEKAGQQDEDAILKQEQALIQAQDDLGSNKLSMEEYKKRRGELAKIRALMFYHEQKRHHINKIKSKKYRRIRKRQRARQKETELSAQMENDPELVREIEEKEEMERMKERMTLAHKNTSKWAKRILKRGKNVDVDTRRALSAQLKRGNDLRKKMESAPGEQEDEDGDDNENLVEAARKVLADTEDDSNNAVKGNGLFQLSFMKRGIEKQRERAKEEARQLLLELEANEDQRDEETGDSQSHDEASDIDRPRSKKNKTVSPAEIKKVLPDGKLVASSLEFGNSNSIAVSGGINIDLSTPGDKEEDLGGQNTENEEHSNHKPTTSSHTDTLTVSSSQQSNSSPVKAGNKSPDTSHMKPKAKAAKVEQTDSGNDEENNPWMVALAKTTTGKNKTKKGPSDAVNKNQVIDVTGVAKELVDDTNGGSQRGTISAVDVEEKKETDDQPKAISSLTQDQLVQMAFATSTETEVVEEFAKEKERLADRDDPTRKKEDTSKSVSGWGCWAGEGAPPPRRPRKLPKHLQPPEKELPKRKRQDDKKPHVIINEKRLKKTANNFQIAHIPYPYKSREEYERAMRGGVGSEWNVTSAVKKLTRPEIYTRVGKVIQPLSKKVKVKRAPAKF